jgi:hypothetical protein
MGKDGKPTVEDIYSQLDWVFGIYYMDSHYPNINITKYYTSNQIKYVLEKMKEKMDTESPSVLKYAGISGHESNIIPYQLLYKRTNLECMIKSLANEMKGEKPEENCEKPCPFASNFIWELSQDATSKEYYVLTWWNNKKIASCDNPDDNLYCKFEDFEKFMTKGFMLTKEERTDMCGTSKSTSESKTWFWIAIVVIVLFLIQLGVFIAYYNKTNSGGVRQNANADEESMDINDRFVKDESA